MIRAALIVFLLIFVGIKVYRIAAPSSLSMSSGLQKVIKLYNVDDAVALDLVENSVEQCVEKVAGGYIPQYITEVVRYGIASAIVFASENNLQSLDDPRVVEFKKTILRELQDSEREINSSLSNESPEDISRAVKFVSKATSNRALIPTCVGEVFDKAIQFSSDGKPEVV